MYFAACKRYSLTGSFYNVTSIDEKVVYKAKST